MNLTRTAFTVFAMRVLTLVIAAVGLLYFTRELGPALFGSFVLFRTLVVLLGMFIDLGINGAIEKRISEGKSGEVLGAAFLLKFAPVAVLFGILYLFKPMVNGFLETDLAVYLFPVIFIDQVGRQYAATLRGEHQVDLAEIGQTLQGISFTLIGMVLLYIGWSVRGLVIALFTSWAVVSLWFSVQCDTSVKTPGRRAVKSVVTFAKYNFVSSLVGHRSYNWMDTFVIGLFMTPTFVGGYEIAWRITKLTTLLSKAIGKTLFPQVSEWDANGSKERIQEVLPDSLLAALLFVIPAIFGITLLGEKIIGILFGTEYTFAVGAAIVLMISKIFDSINDIISRVLLGLDRPEVIARAVVVFITVNAGANLVLVYFFGVIGAAVATSLAILTLVILLTHQLNKEIDVRVDVGRLTVVLGASIGMTAAVWSVSWVLVVETTVELGAIIAFAVLTYFGLLATSADFRTQFRMLWQGV